MKSAGRLVPLAARVIIGGGKIDLLKSGRGKVIAIRGVSFHWEGCG